MKRIFPVLLAVLLIFSGCSLLPEIDIAGILTDATASSSETTETTETTEATETTETTAPPPLHSELYMEGLSVDAAIVYFEEVCLDAEIVNGGDPARLQRWAEPIIYQIRGDPTQEDLEQLARFCRWLETVEGFPGIWEAGPEEVPNVDIHFCGAQRMAELLGDWTWGCDGGVTFWYLEDEIWSATVCIRTDISQEVRNSVILEELYNGLGPVQDTDLREDSIIWTGYSCPQWLTQEDMLILRLLYHPSLEPGMDREACAEAIRKLYY